MSSSVDSCPDCGGKMIERKNRKTGESFLGCSGYPDCRGTREMLGSGDETDAQNITPSERAARNDRRRWRREE